MNILKKIKKALKESKEIAIEHREKKKEFNKSNFASHRYPNGSYIFIFNEIGKKAFGYNSHDCYDNVMPNTIDSYITIYDDDYKKFIFKISKQLDCNQFICNFEKYLDYNEQGLSEEAVFEMFTKKYKVLSDNSILGWEVNQILGK